MASYLNIDFFCRVLEEGLCTSEITIDQFEILEPVTGGENYCSTIYRAKVNFKFGATACRSLSLIIKSMPNVGQNFLERLQVYAKERAFYLDVLPRIEILPQEMKRFAPNHFYSTSDPVQTIVLEDLTCLGFELQSRQVGLDEQHCSIVFRTLGRFHALSMVLMRKDPSVAQRFQEGLLYKGGINSAHFVNLFSAQLIKLATISAEWENFAGISKKLFTYNENFSKNVMNSVFPLEGKVNVLNHGDLWVNNLLFKHDCHGAPIDLRLIDFQFSFCGSLGFDVNYFLYTSVELDVLSTKRDKLIHIYYESIADTLQQLQFETIPTFDEVKREVNQREPYGFFVSFAFFPMMAMHKEDSNDNSLEGLQNNQIAEEKINLMFSSHSRTLDTLKFTLKRFETLGVFDKD